MLPEMKASAMAWGTDASAATSKARLATTLARFFLFIRNGFRSPFFCQSLGHTGVSFRLVGL